LKLRVNKLKNEPAIIFEELFKLSLNLTKILKKSDCA
jgi:hypothetical protein